MSDSQFEAFKKDIALPDYAALEFQYQIDPKDSYRSQIVMRTPDRSDKISIARMPNGHWVYYSFYDLDDHGTIVDFVQNRRGGKLGITLDEVRQELAEWGGIPDPQSSISTQYTSAPPVEKDRFAVLKEYHTLPNLSESRYLADRGIDSTILNLSRFVGRIKVDKRHNVIFPHYDLEGEVCGFERKNRDFQRFVKGGQKSVWVSNGWETDDQLVICEAAIDCLSYQALFQPSHSRYMATAGQWSPLTEQILQQLGNDFPGSQITLAFDNDQPGRKYAWEAKKLLSRSGKTIQVQLPDSKDWNEQLQQTPPHFK